MVLKKHPLSLGCLIVCISSSLLNSSAVFADGILPVNVLPWKGFYAGAGGAVGAWTTDSKVTEAGTTILTSESNGGYGGFGTLISGYDYQFSRYAFVVGGFVDGNLGQMRSNLSFSDIVGNFSAEGSWQIGGRFGLVMNSFALPYVSAGYSRAYFSSVKYDEALPSRPFTGLTTPSFSKSGWFAGLGLETKLAEHWFLKGEYRFAAYQTESALFGGTFLGTSLGDTRYLIRPTLQTFQAVVSYKI